MYVCMSAQLKWALSNDNEMNLHFYCSPKKTLYREVAANAAQFVDGIVVARSHYNCENVIYLLRINNLINYLPVRGFGFVSAPDIRILHMQN